MLDVLGSLGRTFHREDNTSKLCATCAASNRCRCVGGWHCSVRLSDRGEERVVVLRAFSAMSLIQ